MPCGKESALHILAIETSTSHAGVAIATPAGTLASLELGRGRRHVEFTAPAIAFALEHAGISAEAITGIAVGTGPGLFTGLRVGIATGKAMAAALGVSMVGISGLDLLAFAVRHRHGPICAAIDARRGELFWAHYASTPGGVQRLGEPRIGRPEECAADVAAQGGDAICVGDGPLEYTDVFADAGCRQIADAWQAAPPAAVLAELAVPRFVREEFVAPDEVRPVYMRESDAEVFAERRGRP